METQMFNSEQWAGTARELVLVVHPRRKSRILGGAVSGLSVSWEGFWRPGSSVEFISISFLIFLASVPRRCGLG